MNTKDVCLYVESAGLIASDQATAMGALFRAISRLTNDPEIQGLCRHGANQADSVENDMDVMAEHAAKQFAELAMPAEVA